MPRLLSKLTEFHCGQRNTKNLANNLSYREASRLRTKAQLKGWFKRFWLFERILLVITVLGLAFTGLGLLIHVVGRVLDELIVAQVGAYLLVIGIVLLAIRITFWIAEELVKRGLESMINEI